MGWMGRRRRCWMRTRRSIVECRCRRVGVGVGAPCSRGRGRLGARGPVWLLIHGGDDEEFRWDGGEGVCRRRRASSRSTSTVAVMLVMMEVTGVGFHGGPSVSLSLSLNDWPLPGDRRKSSTGRGTLGMGGPSTYQRLMVWTCRRGDGDGGRMGRWRRRVWCRERW